MVFVSVYLPVYDIQGDEIEVDASKLETVEDWRRVKQTLITAFVGRYRYKGIVLSKIDSNFGKGYYKDTRLNRAKHRVGKMFDRGLGKDGVGRGFRDIMRDAIADAGIKNEEKVVEEIERRTKRIEEAAVPPVEVPAPDVAPIADRSGLPWLPKEVAELIRLSLLEKPPAAAQIGARLGRNASSIYSKRHSLKSRGLLKKL